MQTYNQHARRSVIALVLLGAFGCSLVSGQSPSSQFRLTRGMKAAVDSISAASMRKDLEFIASDELEGRNTPSPGLDRAAQYIADQFKKARLQPAGDDGYFQTANWVQLKRDPKNFSLTIKSGSDVIKAEPGQVGFGFQGALNLQSLPVMKVDFKNAGAIKAEDVDGKVIVAELPDIQRAERAQRGELFQAQRNFVSLLQTSKAAMLLWIDRNGAAGAGFNPGRLIDPDNRPPAIPAQAASLAVVQLVSPAAIKLFDALPIGKTDATISINVAAPAEAPVKIRNVVGVLRGRDPVLRDTYVLVTAHYDHLGVNPNAPGPDKIFNGANDDGSGTVSVIEIARALARLKQRPKRSIVFMTVFGEEKGLLGSRYYGRHPIFPIEKTIADINLEQVGRTDDTEGPQVGTCAMTGFDFSNVGEIFKAAGELVGVKVYQHPRNSDAYFGRSDNQALADQGVPAHTLSVAYEYPDYHGAGDTADKVNYDNMAKVDRMVAVGLLMIANNPVEPKWNEANPKAARYLKAWMDRRGK